MRLERHSVNNKKSAKSSFTVSPAVSEQLGSGEDEDPPSLFSRTREITLTEKTDDFLRRHFPAATGKMWQDWRWQLSNSITTVSQLERFIELTPDEKAAITNMGRGAEVNGLPLRITPYYVSLLEGSDPGYPLRKAVVPLTDELLVSPGEEDDPLSEDHSTPVPGLVHRYPDRVLFLATEFCSVYCRYCTRSRLVGKSSHRFSTRHWEEALRYIAGNTAIRDVLISGGDPLTMPNERLEYLLSRLRAIPHVEIIRIGTKVPAVLPQRITAKLTRMLSQYHPLFMSLHFTHPDELTPESAAACRRLADAGIPLGSQTVLLKGVNDDVETMTRLFHELLKARVKPYYLYQCDPISGSSHFRTTVHEGLELIRGIRGFTSGYAVPHYVVDAPGGGGKIPLLPDYYQGEDDSFVYLKNYEGKGYRYPKDIRKQ